MSSIDVPQVHSFSLHTSRSAPDDVIIDILGKSASSHRSRFDPISPTQTQLSRMQEKVNLQGLNDRLAAYRLAAYIVKVHRLEVEKNQLTVQITALQNSISTEVSSVRSFYRKQLAEFQQTFPKTAREKSQFHLEFIDEKTLKNCKRDQLTKQVHDLQNQLEIELLARADLEKRYVMLQEELAFNKEMYVKEMACKQAEISEMSSRLDEEFLARFQRALQDFRSHYEAQMQHNRDEIGTQLYQTEMQNLEGLAAAQQNSINTHLKEMSLDIERSSYGSFMNELRKEIDQFRRQMIVQLQDYPNLMDIDASIDLEIGALWKLLEVEETRLNSTPSHESKSALAGTLIKSPTHVVEQLGIKLDNVSSNQGAEFSECVSTNGDVNVKVNREGKFVRLMNEGDKEVSLGGCWLVYETSKVAYMLNFKHELKIAPYDNIIIWSYDRRPVAPEGETVTTLFNKSGEMISRRVSNPVIQTGFWNERCCIM